MATETEATDKKVMSEAEYTQIEELSIGMNDITTKIGFIDTEKFTLNLAHMKLKEAKDQCVRAVNSKFGIVEGTIWKVDKDTKEIIIEEPE